MVNDWRIAHFPVERHHAQPNARALFRRFNHPLGVVDFLLRWRLGIVEQVNLARINQRFAVEAHLADQFHFAQESSFVIDV